MEKIDEAVELAEEASPADSDAAKPFSGAQVAVDSPMLSSGLPTGALVTTQSSQMTKNDEVATTSVEGKAPLTRASSVTDDFLRFCGRPNHTEKRFFVDRKKLEKLITDGGANNESAEEFFARVQDVTSTIVLWPSRLKVGAKSKKDPQVKVAGTPTNIQRARELILQDLDAKSTRVTLKLDVAFSEHSHVIGKEGANIKKVHSETKCHIHFPDSNRSAGGGGAGEKSSQVSITGQADNVEMARRKIRELLPLVVTVVLPLPNQAVDQNAPEIQRIALQYNVAIHLKPQHQQYSLLVVVRGTVRLMAGVKLAVMALLEYFTDDCHTLPVVSVQLDIASQHHRTLIGSGGGNIRKIMSETSTTVQFPDPQSRYRSNQVTVTGTMEAAFKAREQLLGCLPVVLMFDIHESDSNTLSSSLIGDLMQKLDLFISVKPKKGQLQSVIVKSIEQNIQCMFQARSHLLDCSYQPIVTYPEATADALVPGTTTPLSSSATPSPAPPRTPSPIHVETSSQNNSHAPSPLPPLKETGSKVTFSREPTLISPDEYRSPIADGTDGRRVSFKDLDFTPGKDDKHLDSIALNTSSIRTSPGASPTPTSPTEISRPRSDSLTTGGQKPNNPVKLTTRLFVDYENRREKAQQAMKARVQPSEPRYPTTAWSGNYFSESMPAGPSREPAQEPTGLGATGGMRAGMGRGVVSPSTTPQGLSSINQSAYKELKRVAVQERSKTLHPEQSAYQGVTDLSSLLRQLNLEHYEDCFKREEVELSVFLTMTEPDLKEIGINTLGARRKLQIAISDIKKNRQQQGKVPAAALPRSSASLGRPNYRSGSVILSPEGGPAKFGMNRSASLNRDTKFSHSGRF